MSDIDANMLYIFKDRDPRIREEFKGCADRIFFQTFCTGQYISYTVSAINNVFAGEANQDHLKERMVSLMEALQIGYHSGEYPGALNDYEGAAAEFPARYEALLEGLSDTALAYIRDMDIREYTDKLPADLPQTFAEQFVQDRMDRDARIIAHIAKATQQPGPG